jgi:hypothetical protein
MHVYKFRVLLEDQDDFLRDYEIGSKQTFGDFHRILIDSLNLDGNVLASFSVCDSKWKKMKEITLIDMMDSVPEPEDTFDEDEEPKFRMPMFVMDDVKIKDMIDDPHQRLIYEFDFLNPQLFFIELIKISDAVPGIEYPVCVKQMGQLTKTAISLPSFDFDEIDDEAMMQEVDDMVKDGQLDEEDTADENPPSEIPW